MPALDPRLVNLIDLRPLAVHLEDAQTGASREACRAASICRTMIRSSHREPIHHDVVHGHYCS